jgi:hypothetical protein
LPAFAFETATRRQEEIGRAEFSADIGRAHEALDAGLPIGAVAGRDVDWIENLLRREATDAQAIVVEDRLCLSEPRAVVVEKVEMRGDAPEFHPFESPELSFSAVQRKVVLKGEIRTDKLFAFQHERCPIFRCPRQARG